MRILARILLGISLLATGAGAYGQTTETLVCIRHGEKPANEIGQINAQGLNRALALPDVLLTKYKDPQFIFAPGTTDKTKNMTDGTEVSYLRPLVTIAPTAIRAGLPINTDFGFHHVQDLEDELLKPKYASAMVYVAWEHKALDAMVKKLVADLGGTATVPEWPREDFDSIFVVIIHTDGAKRTVDFRVDHEGITPSETFPTPAAK